MLQKKLAEGIEKVNSIEGTELYKIYKENFPMNTFIARNEIFQDILYKPHIAGITLQEKLSKAGEELAKIINFVALKDVPRKNICELVFLAGGLYYSLNQGFKNAFSYSLPQCFIGIQRSRIEGKEGEFRTRVGYENFESLSDNACVIVGDTIATGTTLLRGLQLLADAAEQKRQMIKKIIVCSLASSPRGAEKIKQLEKRFTTHFPGIELYFIACEQLFHLMPDGTDLRFNMPNAVIPEETKDETLRRYGPWLGENMRCAVFDWGTRCKNPFFHYTDFLDYAEEALKDPKADEQGKILLNNMKLDIETELNKLENPL